MAEVQNIQNVLGVRGKLSVKTSNGPVNQNNPEPSTGLTKDSSDTTSNSAVADNHAAKATPQDTGNLQNVTQDSSQNTTDSQQKVTRLANTTREGTSVTLSADATNSHQKVTKSYLPITQAGFRKGRSVRDNTFSLRVLMEMAIELEKELIVVFVDMEKAFDRISHAFLEEALRDAGASDKSIAMIRVLYAQTKAKM